MYNYVHALFMYSVVCPSCMFSFLNTFDCPSSVYEAFEQWKRLVHLLCSSEQSLLRHAQLFISLVSTMHFQLKEIPEDFFVDIVSRDNFLTKTLQVPVCLYSDGNNLC